MGDAIAGEAGEDRAGSSIVLSESGATLAVAHNVLTPTHDQKKAAPSPSEEATSRGHVRVFQWSNTAQGWRMKGAPIATQHIGDTRGERAAAKPAVSMDGSGGVVSVGSPAFRRRSGHVRSYRWNASDGTRPGVWAAMGGAIDGEKGGDLTGASVHVVNGMNGVFVAIGEPGNGTAPNGRVRFYQLDDGHTPPPPSAPTMAPAAAPVSSASVTAWLHGLPAPRHFAAAKAAAAAHSERERLQSKAPASAYVSQAAPSTLEPMTAAAPEAATTEAAAAPAAPAAPGATAMVPDIAVAAMARAGAAAVRAAAAPAAAPVAAAAAASLESRRALQSVATRLSVFNFGDKAKEFSNPNPNPNPTLTLTQP